MPKLLTESCGAALKDATQWFAVPRENPLKSRQLAPSANELPSNASDARSWLFLAEVKGPSAGPLLLCRDRALKEVRVQPDGDFADGASAGTLASLNAVRLADGRVLARADRSALLPLPLQHVQLLSDIVAVCSVRLCWRCRGRRRGQLLLRCCGCSYARYCSEGCRLEDWARHSRECGPAVRLVARLVHFRYRQPPPPFNPLAAFVPAG